MAQQNKIKEIPSFFKSFLKLKDLRLDRNRIIEISNLQVLTK